MSELSILPHTGDQEEGVMPVFRVTVDYTVKAMSIYDVQDYVMDELVEPLDFYERHVIIKETVKYGEPDVVMEE